VFAVSRETMAKKDPLVEKNLKIAMKNLSLDWNDERVVFSVFMCESGTLNAASMIVPFFHGDIICRENNQLLNDLVEAVNLGI